MIITKRIIEAQLPTTSIEFAVPKTTAAYDAHRLVTCAMGERPIKPLHISTKRFGAACRWLATHCSSSDSPKLNRPTTDPDYTLVLAELREMQAVLNRIDSAIDKVSEVDPPTNSGHKMRQADKGIAAELRSIHIDLAAIRSGLRTLKWMDRNRLHAQFEAEMRLRHGVTWSAERGLALRPESRIDANNNETMGSCFGIKFTWY